MRSRVPATFQARDISPWGDVFIDGKQVGASPPLKVYICPFLEQRTNCSIAVLAHGVLWRTATIPQFR